MQETVRVLVVDVAIVDGMVGQRWLFMLINAMPVAISNFWNGAAAAIIARYLLADLDRRLAVAAVAVLAAGAIGRFAPQPALHGAATTIESTLHLAEPVEVAARSLRPPSLSDRR